MKTIKCAYCGKFLSTKDILQSLSYKTILECRNPVVLIFEPDSHFGPEKIEYVHEKCLNKNEKCI